jgi:hypothetical protein
MAGPGIEPLLRVFRGNAAADLEPAGPGRQRLARGPVVARAELDDVPASDLIRAEGFRKPCRRLVRNEVLHRPHAIVAQAAADDLFDLALVEVDARTKAGHGRTMPARPP